MAEYVIPEMLSLREAARRTGLSYDWLRKMCLSDELVHIRAGNKFLVNASRLYEYLNNGGAGREKMH